MTIFGQLKGGGHKKFNNRTTITKAEAFNVEDIRIGSWNCNGKWYKSSLNQVETIMMKEQLDILHI